nr:MAG TPA: protein of unknown function DUF4752 [Caudoviricetes sp.]
MMLFPSGKRLWFVSLPFTQWRKKPKKSSR